MKISEICKDKKLTFSLEIFPPKKDKPVESLYPTIQQLSKLNPDYISITYGAGGSGAQQQLTLQLASYIQNTCNVTSLSHLTCINSTKEQVDTMLDLLEQNNVENILALRGDIVEGAVPSDCFKHATDLIEHVSQRKVFDIAAACYPEGHPESDSDNIDDEVFYMKKKQDLGASHLVSQLFFDNEDFYAMLEKADKAGITIPIQAGIMPVVNAAQINRMVSLCGAKLPKKFSKIMARYGSNPQAMFDAGLSYATEQIVDLFASGVSGVHIYTMNNPVIAETIHNSVKSLLDSANQ